MMRVRVSLSGGTGGPGLMTFYWIGTVEGSATAQEAVDHVRDFLVGGQANMSSSLTWSTQAEVALITPATGILTDIVGTTSRTGGGTSGLEPLPGQVQGLMSIVTNNIVEGRRIRGHVNLPMPTEAFNGNQVPTATYLSTWATASLQLVTDTDPAYVCWSRPQGPPTPRAGVAGTVNAITIQPRWAALRSRRD